VLNELQLSPDCVARYGEREVEVAATHDTEVIVPLPPKAHVQSVVLVGHDGSETPHRWSPDPHGALIWVPAGGSASRCVRVTW